MMPKLPFSRPIFVLIILFISNLTISFQLHEEHSEDSVDYEFSPTLVRFYYKAVLFERCASEDAYDYVCEFCVEDYSNFIEFYEEIMKNDKGKLHNKTSNTLDELPLIKQGYEYVQHIWLNANCTSGFTLDSMRKLLNYEAQVLQNHKKSVDDCTLLYHNSGLSNIDCQLFFEMNYFSENVTKNMEKKEAFLDIPGYVKYIRKKRDDIHVHNPVIATLLKLAILHILIFVLRIMLARILRRNRLLLMSFEFEIIIVQVLFGSLLLESVADMEVV